MGEVGVHAWRISTGGNGLRPEDYPHQDRQEARRQLGLAPDAFVALYLGRKAEYKGFDVALKAHRALQPAYPHLHLLAVGPDTEYSDGLLDRDGQPPGFLNLGSVPEDTKLAALNACDCLVLPSIAEAFGIVFLEAWLLGKPVIGAHSLAVSTVIDHGRDGFLVAPGDAGDLVRQLGGLLEDPDLARQMGQRGRAKVLNRYTVSRITDIVEGVYLRVLRCHRSGFRDVGRRAVAT